MAHGGKRENSGRKKGEATLYAESLKSKIAELVCKDAHKMISAQIKKANKGDTQAFNSLMDRTLGKPHQGIGIEDKEGNSMVFAPFELILKRNLDDSNSSTK